MNVIEISLINLSLSLILVVASLVITFGMRLGLWKEILLGTVRTALQLFLAGLVLHYLFRWNLWYVTILLLLVMTAVASFESMRRQRRRNLKVFFIAFAAVICGTAFSLTVVTAIVIQVKPWYDPQYMIPIAGMIIGNSMSAASLVLNRLWGELSLRKGEVESYLALGAAPFEASRHATKEAIKAAMTPTINSMMIVGIVQFPGMMTGQIIAGQDPASAVRYQIMVMYMILAAATITATLTAVLGYRLFFTKAWQLKREMFS
ncbi:iron export ABC transporter permease subunit FetB [candidate division WOR-3 bacterium]|nr:iron export ABC transporter permease subunit FetB [candidate division WOR-3 bacterium]